MKYGTYNDFQETSSLLQDSARLAQEADAVGAATVEDLQGQGDKLRESRGHVRHTHPHFLSAVFLRSNVS
jgi:histidine ammonia-lyase